MIMEEKLLRLEQMINRLEGRLLDLQLEILMKKRNLDIQYKPSRRLEHIQLLPKK